MPHFRSFYIRKDYIERDWDKNDVRSKLTKKSISFDVTLDLQVGRVQWTGDYNRSTQRCSHEKIFVNDALYLTISEGKISWSQGRNGIANNELRPTNISMFDYEGSIVSLYIDDPYSQEIWQIKQFFSQLKSLEMLSPHRMRSRSRIADDIGLGGEKLAGYLHKLKPTQKRELEENLKVFYPQLVSISTRSARAGWAQLHIEEDHGHIETESRHINDGLLRILTLIAQVQSEHQFLLFDEIENGINPELAGTLMKYLLDAKQQIMVTTHNPVILNFLPDEKAKESVYFLYRTPRGETKVTRFFDIPEIAEKLEVLGPGEVFLDTSLTQLSEELGRE